MYEIAVRLVRRQSTAAVLFHHAVAERLGLRLTAHKCLDLLIEHGSMTAGSKLATMTGRTSGAVSGVVARLERDGYLRCESDPHDARQQILTPALARLRTIQEVLDPNRKDLTALLDNFDGHLLTTIAEYLTQSTDFIYRYMTLLRAQAL